MAKASEFFRRYKDIIVAVITFAGAIIAALITSGVIVIHLKVDEKPIWIERKPDTDYFAEQSGVVVAFVSADHNVSRHVSIRGKVDDEVIAATEAQDASAPGVPSVSNSSLAMPVPKGHHWKIERVDGDASQIHIKWMATQTVISH